MDADNFSGVSIVGGICAVIMAIIGLFRQWRKDRTDDREEMRTKLKALQDAVNLALEEGRITDAGRLQHELNELWEKYHKSTRSTRSPSGAVVLAVLLPALCAGCLTREPTREYVVIGERIFIVEPGRELIVPPLVPPAKKWYLVDNVGLAGWLGIPAGVTDTGGEGVR